MVCIESLASAKELGVFNGRGLSLAHPRPPPPCRLSLPRLLGQGYNDYHRPVYMKLASTLREASPSSRGSQE